MYQNYHPEKGPFLRDLTPEQRFIGFYLAHRKQLDPFRDPARGHFLTLVLGDRSGQMLARVWDNADDVFPEIVQGEVVKVDGEVECYLERLQIRVLRVRPAARGEYDLRDMLPASPRDPDEMLAALHEHIARIRDPHLVALLNAVFGAEEFIRLFAQAPAARRIHHAYLHGLLEHTYELLLMVEPVIAVYPQLDPDLLLAGILLHDIGKVREYEWELDIDYTGEGRLLGHIVIADEMIQAALGELPDFPPELAVRLRHMLLAHHGRHEFGSPRRPMTLEAIVLHQLENVSAQTNRFLTILEGRPPGEEWSEFDRQLGRQLYAGASDLSIEEQSCLD